MGLLTTKMYCEIVFVKILIKTMGQWYAELKLLNQLGVTAPIESLHNLIETLKSDRPE